MFHLTYASLLRIRRFILAIALPALWPTAGVFAAGGVEANHQTGPHAVLVAPLPAHSESIGIAAQVATLPIEQGTLTIIETNGHPNPTGIAEHLLRAGISPEDRPDWLWIHLGPVSNREELDQPRIRLAGNGVEPLSKTLGEALESEAAFTFTVPGRLERLSTKGVATFDYPSRTPLSRQVRHTRHITTALLREADMIAADATFEWTRLENHAERLVALYDAEGIGGAGPRNLERISAQIEGAGIYRVCGEDIRDGALRPAATVIFPGGSGRGIGNGLQAAGRLELENYISSGGGYIGVCAGAYFAGSGLDNYLQAIELRHSQPWRRGRDTVTIELTSEGKKLFGDDLTVLTTRYANGPVFLPEDQEGNGDPNFVTLATFTTPSTDNDGVVREEMVGQAAIGARSYGDGRILIISPHPESHTEYDGFVGRAISWTMGDD